MAHRQALPGCARRFALLSLIFASVPPVVWAAPGDTTLLSEHYSTATSFHSVYLRDVSADGQYAVFITSQPAFLPAGSGGFLNVLVRDRASGTTSRANLSTTGKAVAVNSIEEAAISADGRYVAFVSGSDAVVPNDTNISDDVFLRDLRAGTTEIVSLRTDGQQYQFAAFPSLSADGRFVAFVASDPANPGSMLRVRDRLTRQTRSWVVEGLVGAPMLSDDGRFLVYRNFRRIVALDVATGRTEAVNVNAAGQLANDQSHLVGVSSDGRYVAFSSAATNLVANDTNGFTDVFVRDRALRTTERVSVADDGRQYPYLPPNVHASLSGDGRFVAFAASTRTVNGFDIDDVFVRDRAEERTRIASVNSAGVKANGHSSHAVLGASGHFVAFVSEGANLAPGDANRYPDVFMHEFAMSSALGLQLAPDALAFGNVAVGSRSATKTVRITNTGTAAVAISWVGLAGPDRREFWSARHCDGTLAPGASCTAEVAFAPASTGPKTGRLVVSIDEGALRRSVALSGTGI